MSSQGPGQGAGQGQVTQVVGMKMLEALTKFENNLAEFRTAIIDQMMNRIPPNPVPDQAANHDAPQIPSPEVAAGRASDSPTVAQGDDNEEEVEVVDLTLPEPEVEAKARPMTRKYKSAGRPPKKVTVTATGSSGIKCPKSLKTWRMALRSAAAAAPGSSGMSRRRRGRMSTKAKVTVPVARKRIPPAVQKLLTLQLKVVLSGSEEAKARLASLARAKAKTGTNIGHGHGSKIDKVQIPLPLAARPMPKSKKMLLLKTVAVTSKIDTIGKENIPIPSQTLMSPQRKIVLKNPKFVDASPVRRIKTRSLFKSAVLSPLNTNTNKLKICLDPTDMGIDMADFDEPAKGASSKVGGHMINESRASMYNKYSAVLEPKKEKTALDIFQLFPPPEEFAD